MLFSREELSSCQILARIIKLCACNSTTDLKVGIYTLKKHTIREMVFYKSTVLLVCAYFVLIVDRQANISNEEKILEG